MGSKSKCTGKGLTHKKPQKAPKIFLCLLCLFVATVAQTPAPQSYVLRPARVFDGESAQLHDGWVVVVRGEKIEAAGPINTVRIPAGARSIDLPGLTLMPGLIDAHSHVLLHPYSETSWNDQVAHEALALRIARATNHLRNTLRAGFTTIRDLGTEGAGSPTGVTSTLSRMARHLFSLIPGTASSSSTRLKPWFFSRKSTMRLARAGPIPGKDWSCWTEAVFRLMMRRTIAVTLMPARTGL